MLCAQKILRYKYDMLPTVTVYPNMQLNTSNANILQCKEEKLHNSLKYINTPNTQFDN